MNVLKDFIQSSFGSYHVLGTKTYFTLSDLITFWRNTKNFYENWDLKVFSKIVRIFSKKYWPPCMLLLFWLRPNLANKYSKIFSFTARARGHLRLCRWIIWAHIFFKSIRINVQVQLMKLRLIYFCSDPLKTKKAFNIHNFKLACKKSAS